MKKFFGLPLFRKPLSDAEYVEKLRKDLDKVQRYGVWLVLLYALLVGAWLYLLCNIGKFLNHMADLFGNQGGNFMLAGFFLGMMLGLSFGIAFLHAAKQLVDTFVLWRNGDRAKKLILKYYDALANLALSQKTDSSDPRQ
jgi:hypothetical protein